jgi:hypothetical protein
VGFSAEKFSDASTLAQDKAVIEASDLAVVQKPSTDGVGFDGSVVAREALFIGGFLIQMFKGGAGPAL